mmetsp:Transcript_21233/g.48221  ORF Transcript_21233/g.48221 Transcript_21233/m.48221 type:complete len:225 (+) Transcript_21233:992-1666(+)
MRSFAGHQQKVKNGIFFVFNNFTAKLLNILVQNWKTRQLFKFYAKRVQHGTKYGFGIGFTNRVVYFVSVGLTQPRKLPLARKLWHVAVMSKDPIDAPHLPLKRMNVAKLFISDRSIPYVTDHVQRLHRILPNHLSDVRVHRRIGIVKRSHTAAVEERQAPAVRMLVRIAPPSTEAEKGEVEVGGVRAVHAEQLTHVQSGAPDVRRTADAGEGGRSAGTEGGRGE